MRDRLETHKRGDRELITDPPGSDYRLVGHYCVYHDGIWGGIRCINSLDCDITPMWALTRDGFLLRLELVPLKQ